MQDPVHNSREIHLLNNQSCRYALDKSIKPMSAFVALALSCMVTAKEYHWNMCINLTCTLNFYSFSLLCFNVRNPFHHKATLFIRRSSPLDAFYTLPFCMNIVFVKNMIYNAITYFNCCVLCCFTPLNFPLYVLFSILIPKLILFI